MFQNIWENTHVNTIIEEFTEVSHALMDKNVISKMPLFNNALVICGSSL